MGKLRSILILVFLVGGVCLSKVRAQQTNQFSIILKSSAPSLGMSNNSANLGIGQYFPPGTNTVRIPSGVWSETSGKTNELRCCVFDYDIRPVPPPGFTGNVTVTATFRPSAGLAGQGVSSFELRHKRKGAGTNWGQSVSGTTGQNSSQWVSTFNILSNSNNRVSSWTRTILLRFQRSTNLTAQQQQSLAGQTIGTFTVTVSFTLGGNTYTAQGHGLVRFWGSTPQTQQQAQAQQQAQNQTGSQQNTQQQWAILMQQQQMGRISGRGTTMILKRRFNPKSGKVELIKNGVISRLGYLNLNRRQALRNYRYR